MSEKTNNSALTIGRMFKLLRVTKGLSARQLTEALGFSTSYISELETGKKEPTLRVLNAYGLYFGIRPTTLLGILEEPVTGGAADAIIRVFEEIRDSEKKTAASSDGHSELEVAAQFA